MALQYLPLAGCWSLAFLWAELGQLVAQQASLAVIKGSKCVSRLSRFRFWAFFNGDDDDDDGDDDGNDCDDVGGDGDNDVMMTAMTIGMIVMM